MNFITLSITTLFIRKKIVPIYYIPIHIYKIDLIDGKSLA